MHAYVNMHLPDTPAILALHMLKTVTDRVQLSIHTPTSLKVGLCNTTRIHVLTSLEPLYSMSSSLALV